MPNKGWKMPEEQKKAISERMKGKMPKNIQSLIEKNKSLEFRKNISERMKGKQYTLGIKQSEEWKDKIKKALKGKNIGEKHWSWKGEFAGPHQMHRWVETIKGKPSKCEHCGTTDSRRYEWANKNHSYLRKEEDYMRLCKSCHMKYDIKNNNYKNYASSGH